MMSDDVISLINEHGSEFVVSNTLFRAKAVFMHLSASVLAAAFEPNNSIVSGQICKSLITDRSYIIVDVVKEDFQGELIYVRATAFMTNGTISIYRKKIVAGSSPPAFSIEPVCEDVQCFFSDVGATPYVSKRFQAVPLTEAEAIVSTDECLGVSVKDKIQIVQNDRLFIFECVRIDRNRYEGASALILKRAS